MKKQLSPKASNKRLDKLLDTYRKNKFRAKNNWRGKWRFYIFTCKKTSQKKILKSLKPTIF